MVLVATVTNFLDVPLVQVILPVYANNIYGSATSLGAMLGALGAGALASTLLLGALGGHRLPRRLTFLSCFVTAPLLIYATLAATPPVAAGAIGGLIVHTVTQDVFSETRLQNTLGCGSALCGPGAATSEGRIGESLK